MKTKILFTLLSTLYLFTPIQAQTNSTKGTLTINGQFRTTGEYRDGYSRPLLQDKEVPGTVIRSRFRLVADYKKDKLSTRITLQDARAWGADYGLKEVERGSVNTPAQIFEAWAQYNFNSKTALRLGRQRLHYGLTHVLRDRNWRDQSLSHDAAVFIYEEGKTKLHAIFSKSTDRMTADNKQWGGSFYDNNYNHKHLAALTFTKKLSNNLQFNLLDLYITKQGKAAPEIAFGLNTVGGNLIYKTEGLFSDLTYYFQHGNTETIATGTGAATYKGIKSTGNLFVGNLGYSFSKLSLSTGFSYYSGQKEGDSNITRFNIIYGQPHCFLGYMDYFGNTPDAGLTDIQLKLAYKASKKQSFGMAIHHFQTTETVYNTQSDPLGNTLGTEVDLYFTRTFGDNFQLKGGCSAMLPTNTMLEIKDLKETSGEYSPTRFANWGYIMVSYSPSFLN